MEIWFIITVTLCISFLLKSILSFLFSTPSSTDFHGKKKKPLPPGPLAVPVIGNLLWLRRSMWEIEPILRDLRKRYGPLVTLRIGPRPAIFVTSHDLAHRALVQNGAVFSDRPSSLPASRILNSNQHNVSSAAYGPTWRLLRRNLTSEILHPSRVKSYTAARTWVLGILLRRLAGESESQSAIKVVDHFQYTMFCLLVLMCFGDRLDENQIKQIEAVQRRLLLSFSRFNVLNLWPRLGKYLFRNRWNELIEIRRSQDAVLIPLIKERIKTKQERENKHRRRGEEEEEEAVVAYVDTLVDLELPEEKRKLNDDEMVSLCSEFLNAGTDTTSTALQWIMANLVKFPQIQAKLYEEITGIVGPPPPPPQSASGGDETKAAMAEVKEEDLHKMPYLKAVVLEGLRRHPPGHFVLPHTVTEDVELDGYTVPKTATVNFMVAEMGLDPNVWEEPLVFKPERFLNSGGEATEFDITGSREIKMMPFGAGRRICPGFGLALLHLEYFVANLVWYFEWSAVDGDDVDMSEKPEFTIVMKNPLRAHLSPRIKS